MLKESYVMAGRTMPPRFLPLLAQRLSRSFSSFTNPNPNPKPIEFPEPLTKTVNKIINQRDPDKIVAAFKKASESYRFRCKHNVYDKTIRRLAAAARPDAVEAILEDQKRYLTTHPSEGFAVRLITLYGRAGMISNAATTFHQLPSLLNATVMSFNALLTVCAEAHDFDRLFAIFADFRSNNSNIVPDRASYNILIQANFQKGDPEAALGIIPLMDGDGVAPDLLTFNIILNGLYNINRFSDAEKVFDEMRERNIGPDTKSYNAKLRGLVSAGRTAEALELFSEIGIKADTYTYNALIKGYCQDGELEEAKRVYMDLIKNDCVPNRSTFETLIPYLCKVGELDLALKLCYESVSCKCFAHAVVMQEVVEGLVKALRVEEAKKLVELGRANNYAKKSLRMPLPCSPA